MAEKDATERRVYNLPVELLERLRAYQEVTGLPSEVEAARRLLDSALQMRDTIDDIFKKLSARFGEERDLRLLARDVLWNHPLITGVSFGDRNVSFGFKGGESGRIDSHGKLYRQDEHSNGDDWYNYTPPTDRKSQPTPKAVSKTTSWDPKPSVDLDDEIPF
jgi:hypothetical protein